MALMSQLARMFGGTPEPPVVEPKPAPEDLRKDALRCLACNSWNRNGLVFMSNGGDYCLGCARQISRRYGYAPAGKRASDIIMLD